MKKSLWPKVLLTAIATCVALGSSPQNAFAQRGGRGGGGMGFRGGSGIGFRGGAVGGLRSSGANYGYTSGPTYGTRHGGAHYGARGYHRGYHAGYGWHGSHNGWHGGYWWYPYYGWSWSLGWPYWGWGYGYYRYNPWYYAPYPYYSYPDYCPPGYSCPLNGNDDPPPANPNPKPGQTPAKPWRPHESAPDTDEGSSYDVRFDPSVPSTEREMIMASNYRVAHSTTQGYTPVRPNVQAAMRALREMPPFARQREIETGRYSHLTAEERALLRNVK